MNVYIGLDKDYSAMRGPCDEGYHITRRADGVTIKDILTTLLGRTPIGADLNTYLLLPSAGLISYNTGSGTSIGTVTRVWTVAWLELSATVTYINGTIVGANSSSADFTTTGYNRRGSGYPIRPVKDVPVVPDGNWVTLLDGSLIVPGAGVFHNSTLGLISLSSDGVDWITISDKNLGATSTDISSTDSYGKYYQWGNNYGFTYGSITTSSTRVDASGYGPGNYYSSSNFIITSDNQDWSTVRNDNLRGGVTGTVSYAELKNAYIGEYKDYLCFTANTAGSTIKLTKNNSPTEVTLETSTNGTTWTTYTIGNTITLSNIGNKVFFRNASTTDTLFGTSTSNFYKFVMTGSIAASGDVNYLLNKNSTTSVSSYCYYALFNGCTSLTAAPKLPATTLDDNCYHNMFNGCTGLTIAPQLPATTLAQYCYEGIFRGCTSLTAAPDLPATTLFTYCYDGMFRGCTGLTKAPALPATTLAANCYTTMFYGCTNLITLPFLPATTLGTGCYNSMFYGCSKIKLSTTQTGEYQTAYRIPKTGTGTTALNAFVNMFTDTGGTFTGAPTINTTYYTSNTVV